MFQPFQRGHLHLLSLLSRSGKIRSLQSNKVEVKSQFYFNRNLLHPDNLIQASDARVFCFNSQSTLLLFFQ